MEQDMANSKTPKLTNGKRNDDAHRHEKIEKARKMKKSIKMRRRRRKRSDLSNSFDSLSDSDTLEIDSADESDLSEGGLDDLDSEGDQSDDVQVESESDEETSQPNHMSKSLFAKKELSCNGNSLSEAGKLLTQQLMKNGMVASKVPLDTSDISDVETGKFITIQCGLHY